MIFKIFRKYLENIYRIYNKHSTESIKMIQIGGYKPDEKKEFTLANLREDLEPSKLARSSTLKNDYKLYAVDDPFTFASVDEYKLIERCTPSGPRYLHQGASDTERRLFNENRGPSPDECVKIDEARKNAVLGKCFTFNELVKESDISPLFDNAYYVVTDIKGQLDAKERVVYPNSPHQRIPCGFTVSTAETLIDTVSPNKKSIRFLRIFNSQNELVKAFFIYENEASKDSARIFIPFRRNDFLEIVKNDKLEGTALLESQKSLDGGRRRRRSSRKYKKSNRNVKSSKKRSYTTKYSRTRRYRK